MFAHVGQKPKILKKTRLVEQHCNSEAIQSSQFARATCRLTRNYAALDDDFLPNRSAMRAHTTETTRRMTLSHKYSFGFATRALLSTNAMPMSKLCHSLKLANAAASSVGNSSPSIAGGRQTTAHV